ncbi:MAG TPA: MarC family protein [Methanocella sp.]|jgi:multiple antibiotic resistance protein
MDIALFLSAVTTIFVMADPFGNIPLFLGLTGGLSGTERRYVITKASVVATIILIVFAIIGQPIMGLLGISLDALAIAGGILLLLIAFDMLMSTGLHAKRTDGGGGIETVEEDPESVAITPMATPLIVGPGVMAATIVFMNKASGLTDQLFILVAVLLAMLGSWIIVVNSDLLYSVLKRDGTRVLTKVMGIVLAAIATGMVLNGLQHAFPALIA